MTKVVEVHFLGRDRVKATFTFSPSQADHKADQTYVLENFEFEASGCTKFLSLLGELKTQILNLPVADRMLLGAPEKLIDVLSIVSDRDHSSILLRELILRLRQEFKLPYDETELCHCRAVPTAVVDRAIVSGAHTVQAVARVTSAGTSCGTCKPDTEKLIEYRLRPLI